MLPTRRAVVTMLGVGLGLVAVDQITKMIAVTTLREHTQVPVVGSLLSLFLIRNPGAAFSLGTSTTWAFSLLAIVALAALFAVAVPRVRAPWWCVAVGLFIAGVGGNLIDRLLRPPGFLRGHVVDFLQLPYWPVFNVADICITSGAVLVIALSTFGRLNVDGTPREAGPVNREQRGSEGPPAATPGD